jgi:hypothetical protein
VGRDTNFSHSNIVQRYLNNYKISNIDGLLKGLLKSCQIKIIAKYPVKVWRVG